MGPAGVASRRRGRASPGSPRRPCGRRRRPGSLPTSGPSSTSGSDLPHTARASSAPGHPETWDRGARSRVRIGVMPTPPSIPRPERRRSPGPHPRRGRRHLDRATAAFAMYRRRPHGAVAPPPHRRPSFRSEVPDVARILTTEMGKTFAAAKAEVGKCAMAMRWFAEHAEELLADQPIATKASSSLCPLPTAGCRAGRDALELPDVAGHPVRRAGPHGRNVGLLKHASNVPQTALSSRTSSAGPASPKGHSPICWWVGRRGRAHPTIRGSRRSR